MPFALEFCLSVPSVLRRTLGDPLNVFFSHLLSSVPGGSEVITSAPHFGPEQLNSRDSGSPVHSCTVTRVQWTLRRMGGAAGGGAGKLHLLARKGYWQTAWAWGSSKGLEGYTSLAPFVHGIQFLERKGGWEEGRECCKSPGVREWKSAMQRVRT